MDIIRDKFITLGNCCFYGLYKRKYISDNNSKDWGETYFFDWIVSNVDSFVKFMECENLDEYFNKKNIWTTKGKFYRNVMMKNINFKSMHDVLVKDGLIERDLFEKYKRRHERIINKIKNEKDLVCFYNGKKG